MLGFAGALGQQFGSERGLLGCGGLRVRRGQSPLRQSQASWQGSPAAAELEEGDVRRRALAIPKLHFLFISEGLVITTGRELPGTDQTPERKRRLTALLVPLPKRCGSCPGAP